MNSSKLLIDEYPLQVLPSLAVKIGLNEAIILQQIHYWKDRVNNRRDGFNWVYNTLPEWQEQFPFWSLSTFRRALKSLEDKELVFSSDRYNVYKGDRTKWYRINYDRLNEIENEKAPEGMNTPSVQNEQVQSQNEQMVCSNRTDGVFNMDSSYTEITTETSFRDIPPPPPASERVEDQPKKSAKKQKPAELPIDEDLKKLGELFDKNIPGQRNSFIDQRLVHMLDDFGLSLIEAAFDHASVSNKSNVSLKFVLSILNRWQLRGFKTGAQALRFEEQYEKEQAQKLEQRKQQQANGGQRGGYGRPGRQEKLPSWFTEKEEKPETIDQSFEEEKQKLEEALRQRTEGQEVAAGYEPSSPAADPVEEIPAILREFGSPGEIGQYLESGESGRKLMLNMAQARKEKAEAEAKKAAEDI